MFYAADTNGSLLPRRGAGVRSWEPGLIHFYTPSAACSRPGLCKCLGVAHGSKVVCERRTRVPPALQPPVGVWGCCPARSVGVNSRAHRGHCPFQRCMIESLATRVVPVRMKGLHLTLDLLGSQREMLEAPVLAFV